MGPFDDYHPRDKYSMLRVYDSGTVDKLPFQVQLHMLSSLLVPLYDYNHHTCL